MLAAYCETTGKQLLYILIAQILLMFIVLLPITTKRFQFIHTEQDKYYKSIYVLYYNQVLNTPNE